MLTDVLKCGTEALQKTGQNPHVKGIKGVSILHAMIWFDIVNGIVPDYMHGVLLGVTKQVLGLMILSTNSDAAFFVGKHIKSIDELLVKIKPTDAITRLPRKLEEHFHNLKASEFQHFLLFYALPCLSRVLPSQYLDNFALFVEGIYLLLGDQISYEILDRAEWVLKTFYQQFENLYGRNNMTLNLHNVGQHLCYYVRQLGPLWSWSCFPFEDMNGAVLEQVHGTGNVCQQILWTINIQKRLAVDLQYISNPVFKGFVQKMIKIGRHVKISAVAENCKIAGALELFQPDDDLEEKLKLHFSTRDLGNVFKVKRVFKNDEIFFSAQYMRMEKRICYIVSLHPDAGLTMGSIQFFVHHGNSNTCAAIVKPISTNNASRLLHNTVSHLVNIEADFNDKELKVVKIEHVQEKLLLVTGCNDSLIVSKIPELFGM